MAAFFVFWLCCLLPFTLMWIHWGRTCFINVCLVFWRRERLLSVYQKLSRVVARFCINLMWLLANGHLRAEMWRTFNVHQLWGIFLRYSVFVEIWRYFSSMWDWGRLRIISVIFVTKIRTEVSVLLGCYAAKISSYLRTFRNKVFVQSSIVRPSKKKDPDRIA